MTTPHPIASAVILGATLVGAALVALPLQVGPAGVRQITWDVNLEGTYAVLECSNGTNGWQWYTNVVFPPATFTAPADGAHRFFRGVFRTIPTVTVNTNKS